MDFWKEFRKLRDRTPRPALRNNQAINSDYINYALSNKNCYLIVGAAYNEDCYYGTTLISSRDCVDSYNIQKCELCYECLDCENCYNANFCQDCKRVRDSWFCFDCIGCESCFGCVSLRNKKYMMFNEPLSKEEYGARLKKILTPQGLRKTKEKFETLKLRTPRVFGRQLNTENCIGDYIFNSKNCFLCFDARECQDCLYSDRPIGSKDLMDCAFTHLNCEGDYMIVSSNQTVNSNFCFVIDFCHDCEYCMYVYNSHHLFGCISRNHAEYEILNQKYPPEAWFKKVREIKEQMKKDGTYGKMLESDFLLKDTIVEDYLRG